MPSSKSSRQATSGAARKPAAKKPQHRVPKGPPSHEIRIIGGQWRRTRLKVIDKPGLRPTPDRVRETLFNWLGQDLSGWRCVDAFAGTGVLGLEAASRGAAHVLMVEQDAVLVRDLQDNAMRLKASMVSVQRGDAVTTLARLPAGSVDLVFIDPPFDGPLFEPALKAAAKAVPAGGWIYLEAPVQWPAEALAALGLQCERHLKAGAVHAHLLQRTA
ncbi:16S rRNA (guanine(966)-N(2))-methyltransferase RsmD [Limnohabitans sp. Rim47]|jgi:16S rRNA (guanine966-N2)-methyltransferase|uniref:16S rRNA (guanine(966)-N(2))-methyltransferase RsmD n=1 Tax=Limnohabitans sp. Rim47 TaxID=1100721 RepID=UPI0002F4BA38|nr:16S rRNA (guanine(966)-N(2))-methyltransferase RsmD [Limnohabitans sp. Rim47]MBP6220504.1 16S rRNA (guanine(966)-N(2))-methyltransferase RsmD [Limnohabitans sp.]